MSGPGEEIVGLVNPQPAGPLSPILPMSVNDSVAARMGGMRGEKGKVPVKTKTSTRVIIIGLTR